MTRVNCVPVQELCNKHLVAEYRELLRFRHAKMNVGDILPPTYRMGTGHVKFFYDKGKFLVRRHAELCREMVSRNIACNLSIDLSGWSTWRMNDWEPDEQAIAINRARINDRLASMGQKSKLVLDKYISDMV